MYLGKIGIFYQKEKLGNTIISESFWRVEEKNIFKTPC